jgi:hypothetical protein
MSTNLRTYCKDARSGFIETHSALRVMKQELLELKDKQTTEVQNAVNELIQRLNEMAEISVAMQIELNEMFPRLISESVICIKGQEIPISVYKFDYGQQVQQETELSSPELQEVEVE